MSDVFPRSLLNQCLSYHYLDLTAYLISEQKLFFPSVKFIVCSVMKALAFKKPSQLQLEHYHFITLE